MFDKFKSTTQRIENAFKKREESIDASKNEQDHSLMNNFFSFNLVVHVYDEPGARETVPVLTSDNGSKNVRVLAHFSVPP